MSRLARPLLGLATAAVLGFIYIPLAVIVIYAFNSSGTTSWPPAGFSTTSIAIAIGAATIAVLLGSLAAFAVARYRFFGRDAISFVVVFPIALPGIVTGMALSTTFATTGFPLGFFSIVVGHATFCVVLVYNNVIARLRRTGRTQEEASADLGADVWQTFRHVTFPAIRSALLAGALLAFALSFDEVIVTIFTAGGLKTLPIWILQSFRLANQVPLVNVAGLGAILLSVVPVYVASRLTQDPGAVAGARG